MIAFHHLIPLFRVRNASRVKAWLEQCINLEKKVTGELHYYFVNKKKILEFNRKFLGHDYVTDIITFDYCEDQTLSGEIYICPEHVKVNALTYAEGNFQKELHRVMIHGVLHLCGYDDHSEAQIMKMRKKENAYLNLFLKNK